MNPVFSAGRRLLFSTLVVAAFMLFTTLTTFAATNEAAKGEVRLVKLHGTVEIIRAGTSVGVFTQTTNQPPLVPGDRLRTGANSGVSLMFSDSNVITAGPFADIEVRPEETAKSGLVVNLWKGVLYF